MEIATVDGIVRHFAAEYGPLLMDMPSELCESEGKENTVNHWSSNDGNHSENKSESERASELITPTRPRDSDFRSFSVDSAIASMPA